MTRAKRSSWSGEPPETQEEARRRILTAALSCAHEKGLRRTTVADVAQRAGITRPTVYAHFADRHAIFHEAFVEASRRLAVGAHAAMRLRPTARERAIEAVAYVVTAFPDDPCLRLTLTDEGFGEFMSQALLGPAGALQIAGAIMEPMFEAAPELRADADETIEVIVRFTLSLLTVPGPQGRTHEELRQFLSRRLVPAIGLASEEHATATEATSARRRASR